VTQMGDIWRIGNHLVACGDATDAECYRNLLSGERARMIFTDPPYNVRIAGNVSGLGRAQHGEFQMASGEMGKGEFTAFLQLVFNNLREFSDDGSLHYICMDWRHIKELMSAGDAIYAELKNLCVWNKTNGGMGTFYRSQHELVFVYKHGTAPHVNNVELGKHGRNRTNVWTYAGANAFGPNRDADLAMHPTVKPVALIVDAILDASNRNDVILDVFGGSGSTLLAAEEAGRRGRAIELDPYYVDTIVRRLSAALKTDATLSGTNEDFEFVRRLRG
jgi:DNA modification methylase